MTFCAYCKICSIKMVSEETSETDCTNSDSTSIFSNVYSYLQIGSLVFVTVVFLLLFGCIFTVVFIYWSRHGGKEEANNNNAFILLSLQMLEKLNCSLYNLHFWKSWQWLYNAGIYVSSQCQYECSEHSARWKHCLDSKSIVWLSFELSQR